MDKPIGVMDSGVGGLTVAKEIMRQLPDERIIYFGDLKRCPYGDRPLKEVKEYTIEVADHLVRRGVKMIVVACNTATAAALDVLEERYDIPVIGVINPGARSAIQSSNNHDVIVLATQATVKSDAYRDAIHHINGSFRITSLACPKFVPIVEQLRYKDKVVVRVALHQTLKQLLDTSADTIILGCTHYPLLAGEIHDYFGGRKKVIDSGYETAREVSSIMTYGKTHAASGSKRNHLMIVNGDSTRFEYILRDWIPFIDYTIEEIDLEG
ncbi:glutamate racemase [Salinicoccus halodurans]|uniref:Glutamate racemase n=1 Tax=Salinicoccus halodurans TaxID=407035 RepID=A0A0F7HL07_9STAP|nr:glutamate racemase [Salinicoccus halodurans]AKG74209.1 glutamate racemase [Salinicoccus halodurans]SFK93078.1 glutamate racemase [Salinicoccus halodurans]